MKVYLAAVAALIGLTNSVSNGFQISPLHRSSGNGLYNRRIVDLSLSSSSAPIEDKDDDASEKESGADTKPTEEESAAMKWAAQQKEELTKASASNDAGSSSSGSTRKKYVIVGAGWGGWGAAKALCESGIDAEVTIIDALPDPTGKTPYLSSTGKPVEAGTRGFWKDYPNICELLAEMGIEVGFLLCLLLLKSSSDLPS